jgi:hypothetical protein
MSADRWIDDMPDGWKDYMPDYEYHGGPGLSSSNIKQLIRSPAHYAQAEAYDSPTLQEGRLIHTAVLEPKQILNQYRVMQPCTAFKANGDACTNAGTIYDSEGDWYCGVHGKKVEPFDDGREIVDYNLVKKAQTIADAVRKNAGEWLPDDINVECSGFYNHDGVLLKIRPDAMFTSEKHGNVIVDLKTTQDGRPVPVTRSSTKYGYHISAAFYCDIAAQLGFEVDKFIWIFVEKTAPFAVSVYQASEATLIAGREMYKAGLEIYRQYQDKERHEWPAYDCTEPIILDIESKY